MNVMTDSELRTICFATIVGRVGPVNAERFIALMNREPRDYTRWRETHYTGEGETIRELGEKIMAYSAAMTERKRAANKVAPAMT